jgi:hypothetical protein
MEKEKETEKETEKGNGGSSGVSEVGAVMSEGNVDVEGSAAMPRVYSRASEGIIDE